LLDRVEELKVRTGRPQRRNGKSDHKTVS
jgi:hypothetical protein